MKNSRWFAGVLFIGSILIVYYFLPNSAWKYPIKIYCGNKIVKEIQFFLTKKGRLPNSLEEIGIEIREDNTFFFEHLPENKYILWFGTSLGESILYDSEMRKWQTDRSY